MDGRDAKALVVGVAAWTAAIPAVILAGRVTTPEASVTGKVIAVGFGVGLAAVTTPLLSYFCGWETRPQRVRGIALALGAAQTIDGVVHLAYPEFYSKVPAEAIASAGNVFFGAGLLGILSVYT
eukprot:INCI5917.6.p1 GENE.INCI5917.6~~INCI5917.6.p1  ORF type:complete len:124 (-),score=24.20 INCI5917.6:173-544(-)